MLHLCLDYLFSFPVPLHAVDIGIQAWKILLALGMNTLCISKAQLAKQNSCLQQKI